MSDWDNYINSRMLKHAGLLRESIYKNRQEELADVYSDTYKMMDPHGRRPRGEDFSKYSEEELTQMIEDLYSEMNMKIEDQSWYDELDAMHNAEEQEIESLKSGPGEAALEKIPPGGAMSRKYESKTRVTESQLQRIVKEEVSRVLKEMEIVNADSGEILTVDQLPPKYAGRLTKADGYDALYDQDFEALRHDLVLDPDEALGMLEDLAAEEMGAAGGDLGTAIDIAMGFKMSYTKEWNAALRSQRIKDMYYEDEEMEFETINDALARFLAERMG